MSNFKSARHLVVRLVQILKLGGVPLKGTGGNIDSPAGGHVGSEEVNNRVQLCHGETTPEDTCGFLGSSSSFLPRQLFFGTWQSARSDSCLTCRSDELQTHNG